MIIELLILILSVPSGLFLAYISRDELINGRKWFRILIMISLISEIWFFLQRNKPLIFTLAFIFIVSLISYTKSFDKKWTKK